MKVGGWPGKSKLDMLCAWGHEYGAVGPLKRDRSPNRGPPHMEHPHSFIKP